MRPSPLKIMPFLLLTALAGRGVPAALIEIDSGVFFTATTTADMVITFEGADTSATAGYTGLGKTAIFSGVTFTDSVNMYAVTSGFGAVNNNGNTYLAFDGGGNGNAALPTKKTAVGFTLYSDGAQALATLQITTSDGNTITVSKTPTTPNVSPAEFLGFVETTPGVTISSVFFNKNSTPTNNQTPSIDNFTYGTALVPEPAGMIGSIAAAVLGLRRRRTHRIPD